VERYQLTELGIMPTGPLLETAVLAFNIYLYRLKVRGKISGAFLFGSVNAKNRDMYQLHKVFSIRLVNI